MQYGTTMCSIYGKVYKEFHNPAAGSTAGKCCLNLGKVLTVRSDLKLRSKYPSKRTKSYCMTTETSPFKQAYLCRYGSLARQALTGSIKCARLVFLHVDSHQREWIRMHFELPAARYPYFRDAIYLGSGIEEFKNIIATPAKPNRTPELSVYCTHPPATTSHCPLWQVTGKE